MEIATVTTADDNALLRSIRGVLDGADDALLAVAFVQSAGVHLVGEQLKRLGSRARLLLTTAFSTNGAALAKAHGFGAQVSLLNPAGGTYHPKVYLARRRTRSSIFIGSSNLTGGLVNNVEAGVVMHGTVDDAPIRDAWSWAEARWNDRRRIPWSPTAEGFAEEDVFEPELLAALKVIAAENKNLIWTLGPTPKPNRIIDVTPSGVYIETDASKAKNKPPQLVPAWMLTLAWDYLRSHGRLTNRYLLATDGLNVKRSSAVCALLAKLPGVKAELSADEGIVLTLI